MTWLASEAVRMSSSPKRCSDGVQSGACASRATSARANRIALGKKEKRPCSARAHLRFEAASRHAVAAQRQRLRRACVAEGPQRGAGGVARERHTPKRRRKALLAGQPRLRSASRRKGQPLPPRCEAAGPGRPPERRPAAKTEPGLAFGEARRRSAPLRRATRAATGARAAVPARGRCGRDAPGGGTASRRRRSEPLHPPSKRRAFRAERRRAARRRPRPRRATSARPEGAARRPASDGRRSLGRPRFSAFSAGRETAQASAASRTSGVACCAVLRAEGGASARQIAASVG